MLSDGDRRVLRDMERQFRRDDPAWTYLFEASPSDVRLPLLSRPRTYTLAASIAALIFLAAMLLDVPAMVMTGMAVALLSLLLRLQAIARRSKP